MTSQLPKEKEMPVAANACLLLASLVGAALLLWWAIEFHRDNRQLWMVPCGLIFMGTPIVVWFSLVASDVLRSAVVLLAKVEHGEQIGKESEIQEP